LPFPKEVKRGVSHGRDCDEKDGAKTLRRIDKDEGCYQKNKERHDAHYGTLADVCDRGVVNRGEETENEKGDGPEKWTGIDSPDKTGPTGKTNDGQNQTHAA
jgi:hypothetical protein